MPNGWPSESNGTVTSVNGPAAAVTPAACSLAVSCAAVASSAFTVRVRSAPCWAANAWLNGALLATISPRPRVAEAVETSSTMHSTNACTLCRRTPPLAVRTTERVLMRALPGAAAPADSGLATRPSTIWMVRAAYVLASAGSWVIEHEGLARPR